MNKSKQVEERKPLNATHYEFETGEIRVSSSKDDDRDIRSRHIATGDKSFQRRSRAEEKSMERMATIDMIAQSKLDGSFSNPPSAKARRPWVKKK